MSCIDDLERVVNGIFLKLNDNNRDTKENYVLLYGFIKQNILKIKSIITNSCDAPIGDKRRLETLLGKLLTFEELCLNKIGPTRGAGLQQNGEEEEEEVQPPLQWRKVQFCNLFCTFPEKM